uniref:Uncharacterized protein n=1 Tax=Rhizophora mucronata TaxID=61149 RepID=A0A2P2LN26_RHIMU
MPGTNMSFISNYGSTKHFSCSTYITHLIFQNSPALPNVGILSLSGLAPFLVHSSSFY